MAKKDAAKALPRLRFPEFVGEAAWEYAPLATVCTVLQGYGFPESLQGKENGKYPFCKVSDISRAVAENGSMLGEAANYIDDAELAELRARIVPKGATVFAKIGEALKLNRRAFVQRPCLIDNNVVGIKAIDGEANDYFIYLLSQQIDLNEHCGGAVPSVNKSTLEAIKISIPGYAEQAIIANCLSSLDELIAAQGRKVEALKARKRGLMQVLFPREGETRSRLRFPEFQKGPEWERERMEMLYSPMRNNTLSREKLNHTSGTVKNIHYGDIHTKFSTLFDITREIVPFINANEVLSSDFDPQDFCIEGDMIFADASEDTQDVGKSIELIRLNNELLLSGQHTILARRKNDSLVVGFGGYLFKSGQIRSQIQKEAQGTKVFAISWTRMSKIEITYPGNKAEQLKIASCLSTLDSLITAEINKLDALKTHKKGLMQKLFPVMEGD